MLYKNVADQLFTGIRVSDEDGTLHVFDPDNFVDADGKVTREGYEGLAFLSVSGSRSIGTKSVSWFDENQRLDFTVPRRLWRRLGITHREGHSFQFHYTSEATFEFWEYIVQTIGVVTTDE